MYYSYFCQELKTLPYLHTADIHTEFGMYVKTISSGKWLRSLLLLLSGNGVPNCSPDWLCCSWCFIFRVLKVQVNHTYHMTSLILWLFLPWKGKIISVSFVLFIFLHKLQISKWKNTRNYYCAAIIIKLIFCASTFLFSKIHKHVFTIKLELKSFVKMKA